jgi:quinol monooxygenase YgiN
MNAYYVYYKVAPEQLPAVRRAVRELFERIERECGVRGRWLRRRDDAATYMEVYEDVRDPAAFEALLEREGAKLGLPRKLERFIPAETPS